jgi:hypothetical protein
MAAPKNENGSGTEIFSIDASDENSSGVVPSITQLIRVKPGSIKNTMNQSENSNNHKKTFSDFSVLVVHEFHLKNENWVYEKSMTQAEPLMAWQQALYQRLSFPKVALNMKSNFQEVGKQNKILHEVFATDSASFLQINEITPDRCMITTSLKSIASLLGSGTQMVNAKEEYFSLLKTCLPSTAVTQDKKEIVSSDDDVSIELDRDVA